MRASRIADERRESGGAMAFIAPVLALALASAAGCGGPPRVAGPFQAYPASPALDAIVRTHAEAANDREERLLLMTWFLDGDPRVAMMCSVRPDGHVNSYRYVHDWAVQNSRSSELVADQTAALRQAIAALPDSSQHQPSLTNLLIVSYRRGGEWVTGTFDRNARPPALDTIYSLTAAPIQPAVAE